MQLRRHALSLLALLIVVPTVGATPAEAAFIRRSVVKTVTNASGNTYNRVTTTVSGDAGTVASVLAELSSDAGDEDLALVESNAWLHGAATISTLPLADAELVVTLYDSGSASLMSFSGTLRADGGITLTADEPSDKTAKLLDIEALGAELFPVEKGYDLALDLAGVDTYAVAYASITVTEPAAELCIASDEKGNCLKWESTKAVTTGSEVFWDDIGAIWEADATLVHEGLVELKVKPYDADGKKIESVKSVLGAPWRDSGEGVNSLATDEDPLTSVALSKPGKHYGCLQSWHAMCPVSRQLAIVSEAWSTADALPISAQVELTDGQTVTIPVSSYQRGGHTPTTSEAESLFKLLDSGRIVVSDGDAGSATIDVASLDELATPLCSEGFCVVLTDDDGAYGLAVTAYGLTASALPDTVQVSLTAYDVLGEKLGASTDEVALDEEVSAVFAQEVSFSGDPADLDLSGKVKLLGEPNSKGKQKTLSKGNFYGAVGRDNDGDLELAAAEKGGSSDSGDASVGIVFGAVVKGESDTAPAALASRNIRTWATYVSY